MSYGSHYPHFSLKSLLILVGTLSVSFAILSLASRGGDWTFMLLPVGGSMLGATVGSTFAYFVSGPNDKRIVTTFAAAMGFFIGGAPLAVGLYLKML